MATIIDVIDLPSALRSQELVQTWVDGANSKASRVAPCLVPPTSTAWAATTGYAVGDKVKLAFNEYVEATVAGSSGDTQPDTPAAVDLTVVDGTVTWKRIGPTADYLAEAKLVLLGAIQRWSEAGSGALSTQSAGPFSMGVDTRQRTGFNLWPSEITDLQAICRADGSVGRTAFSIDTTPSASGHAPWCDLMFGGTSCSCGVSIAGEPMYEPYF